ncbi:hypothetical protein RhiirA1_453218 [Rhizophagus irregularis]|uniref:Uncharacterized protein n=1 Tax=Rhizophagus irregularis TaxID=588596 RepID=A0A2N0S7Z2_9GLOM|nr:hypothetical protein RhiirA1_453218 [Rhizophagus irregularis]CAB4491837.1 unnamed protein product [Rhizophagus irregularis]
MKKSSRYIMVDNQELSIQTEIFHSLAVVAPKKGQRKFPSLLECATNIERSIRSKNVPKNLISVLINELTNPNQNQADVMFIIQGESLNVILRNKTGVNRSSSRMPGLQLYVGQTVWSKPPQDNNYLTESRRYQ